MGFASASQGEAVFCGKTQYFQFLLYLVCGLGDNNVDNTDDAS